MAKDLTNRRSPLHFEQVPLSVVKASVPDTDAAALSPKAATPAAPAGRMTGAVPHLHAVQFYDSPDRLCRIVGQFIGEGLEQGAPAVLIVTPDHGARIVDCLRQGNFDVDALSRNGTLTIVDGRETLNQFMLDGMPNPGMFRRAVGGLLKQSRGGADTHPVRAYGEMVDLLWKDGREAAAIRLETLWNQLARNVDFELICGYAMGNFYKGSMLDEIERQHTHVARIDGGTPIPVRPVDVPA
jgi:hypothetical protein